MKRRAQLAASLMLILCPLSLIYIEANGQPGNDLNPIVKMAKGGDTINVAPGNYTALQIQDLHLLPA